MTSKKRSGRSPGNPAGRPSRPLPGSGQAPGGILTQKGEELLVAGMDLLGHTGAEFTQLRYCNEELPVVWMAVGKWGEHHKVGAGMNPVSAVLRLLDDAIDGGTCQHCKRPTGVSEDFDEMPLDNLVCWYQYDPELKKFRRGCAGES